MTVRQASQSWWKAWSAKLLLADLLEKRWMEPVVPFTFVLLLFLGFALTVPNYLSVMNLQQLVRDFSESGLVAIAIAFAILSGGIDLSVGATFALANFVALYLFKIQGLSALVAIAGVMLCGGVIGALNGWLVAYVKARPFLTTLSILLILRAVYDSLTVSYTAELATADRESALWDFIGNGTVFGIPFNGVVLIVVGLIAHVCLTRVRLGLHIMAIGASRKAARHAGINVSRVLFASYVFSGLISALAGMLYVARQNSAGPDTGQGWEITALTAVVVGGLSLAGGRGTIARALIGAVATFLLMSGLLRMNVPGALTSAAIGMMLLLAVAFNVKWAKNKGKALQKIYVNPVYLKLDPPPSIERGSDSPFAINDALLASEAIGLNQIEGPEDIILDRQDRLYAVNRTGEIIRFSGPGFGVREEFARIGGRPLGMAFDRDENLIVCVAGMGVYGVRPDGEVFTIKGQSRPGEVFKVTDETNQSWWKLRDDSRLSLADDLDIGPDGKIYFSEATLRYDIATSMLDGLEGRGNGRMICHDPSTGVTQTILRNIPFPNGVCLAHDGKSILFCSTWLCAVYRYWLEGDRKGQTEVVIDNLPGYPDNVNRASDGTYWVALVGIRAPAYDLAMEYPDFRLRMVKQIPPDQWMAPNINNGCIVKFDNSGKALRSLWDPGGQAHATITSVREHKGWLYIGGLENNRIGRVRLPDADPNWVSWDSYWAEDGRQQGERHVRAS